MNSEWRKIDCDLVNLIEHSVKVTSRHPVDIPVREAASESDNTRAKALANGMQKAEFEL